MQDERKLTRKQTPLYLKVFDNNTQYFSGSLVDLTIEGMKIYSWRPITIGAILQCELVLPDEINGRKFMSLKACCVWCKPRSRPDLDFFEIGFKLEHVTTADQEIIEGALEKFFVNPDALDAGSSLLNHIIERPQ